MKLDEKSILWRLKKRVKRLSLIAIPGIFLTRVLSGFRAYRKILTACPPEEGWKIWFMDYDGSGDTYLTCGYLQSQGMIGEHDAFAASGGLSRKIAELFPFGRYTQIKPKEALCVRFMERFWGQKLNVLPLLYESEYLEYSGILRRMAGWRKIDFMTMLKIGLEVNSNVPFQEGAWKAPVFPYQESEIDEIFEKNKLIPGKTVLLAPYAGKSDLWGIPLSFYEELTQKLIQKGYIVCTNSMDPQKEPPVPGTRSLLVSHRLIQAFCEKAGGFISLRSGLCDIVSSTKDCIEIILYSPNFFIKGISSYFSFFSIKMMKLRQDKIFEIEIKDEKLEKIYSQILLYFK